MADRRRRAISALMSERRESQSMEAAPGAGQPAHSFLPRRGLAWGQLVLGWVCAQGLLTLIPIAPPGWGAPALLVSGGGFAAWALVGLRRAITERPMLSIGAEGIAIGHVLGVSRVPWSAVMHWRVVAAEKRLAIALSPAWRRETGRPLLLSRGRGLALDARLVDASLSDIVRAFRETRPDLEAA